MIAKESPWVFGDKDNKNNKKNYQTIHSSISFDLIFILLKILFLYFQKYSINQKIYLDLGMG